MPTGRSETVASQLLPNAVIDATGLFKTINGWHSICSSTNPVFGFTFLASRAALGQAWDPSLQSVHLDWHQLANHGPLLSIAGDGVIPGTSVASS